MSCDWGVSCRTCNDELPLWDMNHGDVYCHELAVAAPQLAVIAQLAADLPQLERFDVKLVDSWSSGSATPLSWFLKHQGHDIEAKNEYGEYYDRCNESIKCGTCGHQEKCQRKSKHDGECSPKVDT